MAANPKNLEAKRVVSKFAKTLLGATCLTAATGGAAVAGTITYQEGVGGQPSDWSNTFGAATSVAGATIPGTTILMGSVAFAGGNDDPADFVEVTGLGAGTFTVSALSTGGEAAGTATLYVLNSSDTLLEGGGGPQVDGAGLFGPGGVNPLNFGSMAIPGDGNLVIEVEEWHEGNAAYTVTINTANGAVPEPGTLGLVGLGLAGALRVARRRRLKK
jgi:hypothetical protein